MSAAFHSVIQIDKNAGAMPTNAVMFRRDQLRAGKEDRAEIPLAETIVGRNGGLRGILSLMEAVAPTNMAVLIGGRDWYREGTHCSRDSRTQSSAETSLVKVNCAAIPAGLLESELFGHERGAFTGAVNSHVGRFT